MPITNPMLVDVKDEGTSQGRVTALDFTGAGVTATVAGTTGTVNIPGGSGSGWTHFTQDLGAARRSGTFDITGLSGLTADQYVAVTQTARAIASKGNARDEFEMDPIVVTGYVVDATTVRCYWSADMSVVVGTYAFAYLVNA
jgi:hypothetical protein